MYNASHILPSISRIVWFYKQWQPIYEEIQKTVWPKVEFIQGIPIELQVDDFFDPKINNLLLFDDFYESTNRLRINDLYCVNSHHRNISVVSINQNLYANKDPTQRRNCYYLILFNNPVDKLSVFTLAKQMYPRNTDVFMNMFGKATKKPYRYLVVDLKPYTKEQDRLKYDLIWEPKQITTRKLTNEKLGVHSSPIKRDILDDTIHSCAGTQTEQIDKSFRSEINSHALMSDKMNACDDCGILFDTQHDVQRHVKRGLCAEKEESPMKKRKEEKMDSEDEYGEDLDDNEGFVNWWQKAVEKGKDKFLKFKEKYMDDGKSENEATEMAENRLQSYNEREFMRLYASLLEYIIPMDTNGVHVQIVRKIKDLVSNGSTLTSATNKVLKKNMDNFVTLFEIEIEDSDESGESESENEQE